MACRVAWTAVREFTNHIDSHDLIVSLTVVRDPTSHTACSARGLPFVSPRVTWLVAWTGVREPPVKWLVAWTAVCEPTSQMARSVDCRS